jgi:hypothetical protein
MASPDNTYTPPSGDQVKIAAMNKGCTAEGADMVAEIVAEYPDFDLQEVIGEVAGSKSDDKNQVIGKLVKDYEKGKKGKAEEAAMREAAKKNNAAQPGTKEYNTV